jgi:hypothetical protein
LTDDIDDMVLQTGRKLRATPDSDDRAEGASTPRHEPTDQLSPAVHATRSRGGSAGRRREEETAVGVERADRPRPTPWDGVGAEVGELAEGGADAEFVHRPRLVRAVHRPASLPRSIRVFSRWVVGEGDSVTTRREIARALKHA